VKPILKENYSLSTSWISIFGAVLAGAGCVFAHNSQKIFAEEEHEQINEQVYKQSDVASHCTDETGIWVTYKDGVYDITDFVANHPGGKDKILLAAGSAIDPFWNLYRQHLTSQTPTDILKELRIGRLDPEDYKRMQEATEANPEDPYSGDPARHPALRFHSTQPCNAELPLALLDSWVTPVELFFVRHHHPVPHLDPQDYSLKVRDGVGGGQGKEFTLQDLKTNFTKHTVTSTLQCGGNRRSGMNLSGKTSGTPWGCGALSNAEWGGARLVDVLAAAELLPGPQCHPQSPQGKVAHVQFVGADEMTASIPVEKALNPYGDVILAWEMNGEPIPADHGAPLRVIVPGHVGVRNVKWVTEVVTRDTEAEGMWQRGMAYKLFPPSLKSLEGVDVESRVSMQELPVQSAITRPSSGSVVEGLEVEVQGYAYSGGGRGIAIVEVSVDGGQTWHVAELKEGRDQPVNRAWAWTFWTIDVPISHVKEGDNIKICCRATDVSCNNQPETVEPIWNLRGLSNNSYHCINVTLDDD